MLEKNLAAAMRVLRASRNQSITEFAEDLGIARSSLQDILSGTGNPRMDTVEFIAEQLDVDPVALLSGAFDESQLQTAILLLNTIDAVSRLPAEQQIAFGRLFQQMILLLNPDEPAFEQDEPLPDA